MGNVAAPIGQFNAPVGTRYPYPIPKKRVIAGGAAGNLTVTGIALDDVLITVINLAAAGDNLVSEFTVTAANTINNTGGTNTTGMVLLVEYFTPAHGNTGR